MSTLTIVTVVLVVQSVALVLAATAAWLNSRGIVALVRRVIVLSDQISVLSAKVPPGARVTVQAGPHRDEPSPLCQTAYERGAREMFAYYTRYINDHGLATVAFDAHLRVLKPFLAQYGLLRPEDGALEKDRP